MAQRTEPRRTLYDLYWSDVRNADFRTLFKKETRGAYEFYAAEFDADVRGGGKLRRGWRVFWALARAFVRKLSPARRLLFTAIVVAFALASSGDDWLLAWIAFVGLLALLGLETAERVMARDELEAAREIQTRNTPASAPEFAGYETALFYETAREVGGDAIDFARSPESLTALVADASGKGLGAALYAAQADVLFRHLSRDGASPSSALVSLNDALRLAMKPGSFLTAALARFGEGGTVRVCRAGHPPPLVYRAAANEVEALKPKGIGLGLVDRPLFASTLETIETTLAPGDALLLYTDGATEAMNRDRVEFGEERLRKVFAKQAPKSAERALAALAATLDLHRGDAPLNDDRAIVLVKRAFPSDERREESAA
jgi:phosphoserine phosphatase RsbU/P